MALVRHPARGEEEGHAIGARLHVRAAVLAQLGAALLRHGLETRGLQVLDDAIHERLQTASDCREQRCLAGFDLGSRPGTFDSCGIRNRLDYLFLSENLVPAFRGGAIFRKGLFGHRPVVPTEPSAAGPQASF